MKIKNKSLALLMVLVMVFTFTVQVTAKETEGRSNKGHQNKTGETRILKAGDEIIFKIIPAGQEQPIEEYYYERITDKTFVTPMGETVRLNSMGTVGEPPSVYFAFNQDEERNINFYGVVFALDPSIPETVFYQEWVVAPESGYCLNYPGQYYIGQKWEYKFKMLGPFGDVTSVELVNEVVAYEKITIGAGKFKAFKIIAKDAEGNLESISWFAPELGVNIRRYSYSNIKPGYELAECSFTDN